MCKPKIFGGNPKSFKGNSVYFYCDKILTYYSGFKAAAIEKEQAKVYYDGNITCCGEDHARLNSSLWIFKKYILIHQINKIEFNN